MGCDERLQGDSVNSKTGRERLNRYDFKVGDLVRYKQGACDYIGVIVDDLSRWGDYEVLLSETGKSTLCSWRYLRKLS